MNRKQWNKRLRTCLCAVLAIACALSSIPASAISWDGSDIEYVNVAQGCSYEFSVAPSPSYGDSGNELTDGKVDGASIWSGGWVGFSGQENVDITLDLGSDKEILGVEAVFLNDIAGGGVKYPSGIFTFSYSTDGQDFIPFHEGSVPEDAPKNSTYTYTYAQDEEIQARYVRLSFGAQYWVFIGELRVLAYGAEKPHITENFSDLIWAEEEDQVTLSVDASVSDGGTLSYQWYKGSKPVGTDSSLVLSNVAMADAGSYYVKVTNTLNGNKAVRNSKTCELKIRKKGATAEKPVITTNLDATRTIWEKTGATLSVAATSPDGGYLSYQWYKDGEPVGVNSSSFVLENAALSDSGSYKVVVKNTKDGAENTVESTVCVLTVEEVPDNNLVLGRAYELSEDPSSSYEDTDHVEMTDGKYGTNSYTGAAWMGWANVGTLSVTFDLGAKKSFEEVRFNALKSIVYAIKLPQSVAVYTSNDKENWQITLFSAISDSISDDSVYTFKSTLAEAVTARYVRVDIKHPDGWFFVDEIEVLAQSMDNPDAAFNNIAVGKSYTSVPAADSAYPDSASLTELTDGYHGSAKASHSAWVGYGKSGKDTEIAIDLGGTASFEQVNVKFLNDPAQGIYLPAEATVSYSANGSSWQKVGTAAIAPLDSDEAEIYNFQYGFDTVTARYVKVSFPADAEVLLDEIEVLKNRTAFPEQDADEIYANPNNLAVKRPYTTSWTADAQYPDLGNELTDGTLGSYLYTEAQWSGYEAREDEPFTVTVDLGEVKNFEQAQVGVLKSSSRLLSIQYPTHVKVEYSADNANWDTFAEANVNTNEEGVQRLNYVSNAVAGRYVRFTFEQNGLLMLDEIAVYEKAIPGGDYENNPDAGDTYNLLRGRSYTVSRPAEYRNTMGLLTDGKYGQNGTRYDKNWTGFLRSDNNSNSVEVVFDLEASYSIGEIIVSTRKDSANHQAIPQNLRFWVSQDGKDWAQIASVPAPEVADSAQDLELAWNGETDGFNSKTEGATMVYTRYIKVIFDLAGEDGVYTYLDEIKAMGKQGQCSNASEPMSTTGHYNVALSKPYTSNPMQKSVQSDIGGKQLTDGIFGTKNIRDPAWVSLSQGYRTIATEAATKASL